MIDENDFALELLRKNSLEEHVDQFLAKLKAGYYDQNEVFYPLIALGEFGLSEKIAQILLQKGFQSMFEDYIGQAPIIRADNLINLHVRLFDDSPYLLKTLTGIAKDNPASALIMTYTLLLNGGRMSLSEAKELAKSVLPLSSVSAEHFLIMLLLDHYRTERKQLLSDVSDLSWSDAGNNTLEQLRLEQQEEKDEIFYELFKAIVPQLFKEIHALEDKLPDESFFDYYTLPIINE